MVLPFSIKGFLHKRWTPFNLFISIFTIGLLIVGVWKAQSRAAYIAIGTMGAGYFSYQFRHNKKILRIGVMVCLLGAIVLSQLNLGRSADDLQDSKMNRLGYWKAGIAMAIRNPVFGVGLDQFPKNYGMYGAANFSEGGDRTAHSSWVLIVSETGFPGLFFLLLIYLFAVYRSWRLANHIPELLLCLLGYGVTMSFLSHSYVLYPYLLTSLCFAYPLKVKEDVV
jgi:O-antigen ligase